MNAARQFGFEMVIAAPKGYEPEPELLKACAAHVSLTHVPKEAVHKADIVVTDTWASMGQESEKVERLKAFQGYKVDNALMQLANKDAVFMHCLPAYRDVEVATEVIDGPQSVVWDEAENRLHAQKALLELLLAVPHP
jgi:ornithine carbamoyltransferase